MQPLQIQTTEDGTHTLLHPVFGVTYHSKHGAAQETDVVFLKAGLQHKATAIQNRPIRVLEIGFGTGLNALMTLLEARKLGCAVEYLGLEAHPIDIELVEQLNYPELLNLELEDQGRFIEMHKAENANQTSTITADFIFEKRVQTFETFQHDPHFDVIYFDAFAPNAQPQLWEKPLLEAMYNALTEEGVLVTYCAKGAFKRTLKSIGFQVEALPGPKGKREMTRALKG